jgi:Ran GTPase-activating protein (RanGAP) involved in mRNA processing and transport
MLSEFIVDQLYQSKILKSEYEVCIDGRKTSKTDERLNDESIEKVLLDLRSTITSIQFPFNELTSKGLKTLAFYSRDKFEFEYVDLQSNNISGENIDFFILQLDNIKQLNLSSNTLIGKNGALSIGQFLIMNQTLTHLYLNNCGFGLTSLLAITTSLSQNNTLITLELDRPCISSMTQQELCTHFGYILQTNHTLEHISLRYCAITDEGIQLIINGLYLNKSLKSLNLEGNRIGIQGSEALSKYLSACITIQGMGLTQLYLSNNPICDKGCLHISQVLIYSKTFFCLIILYYIVLVTKGIGEKQSVTTFNHEKLSIVVFIIIACRISIEKFLFENYNTIWKYV